MENRLPKGIRKGGGTLPFDFRIGPEYFHLCPYQEEGGLHLLLRQQKNRECHLPGSTGHASGPVCGAENLRGAIQGVLEAENLG